MVSLLCLALALLAPDARAESASVLPGGSAVIYGGLGLNRFSRLQFADNVEGQQEIDPGLRLRADLYTASGLTDALQLSIYVPVVHGRILEQDERGPCPGGVGSATEDDYCDAFTTVGAPNIQARYALLDGAFKLTPALALGGDPWNADLRGRLVTPSDAVAEVAPGVYLGGTVDLGSVGLDLLGAGTYALRFGRLVDGGAGPFRAPADEVRWSAEARVRPPGPVSVELGLHGVQRLWGVDWDASYQSSYFTTLDRWTALWYRHLAGSAKLSVALSDSMGLHVGAGRVLSVRNGPPDTLDFTVGVHRYFAPRS